MNVRATVWFVLTLTAVLTVAGLILMALGWSTPQPGVWGVRGYSGFYTIALLGVGAIVAARRPANRIAWIFLAAGLTASINYFSTEYASYTLVTRPDVLPGGLVAAWVVSWIWVPLLSLLAVFLPLLFPTGRLRSTPWRVVIWLDAAGVALAVVGFATLAGPLNGLPAFNNPFPLTFPEAPVLFLGGLIVAAVSAALAVVSLILRLRRATGDEREQLKWFASAGVIVAVAFVLTAVEGNAEPAEILMMLALTTIPLAAGVAILKYRLYDIDLLIRRTLIYGTLTGSLGLLYIASVIVLQQLLRALAGQSSDVAVVASTLAMVALFEPFRRRIQVFIDRRFYRRKYDAARVLAAFGATVRDEVDLTALSHRLIQAVDESLNPSQVSLWWQPTGRLGMDRLTKSERASE